MTYIKVGMTEKESGFTTIENVKAETIDDALEIAEESFPYCEDFHIASDEPLAKSFDKMEGGKQCIV